MKLNKKYLLIPAMILIAGLLFYVSKKSQVRESNRTEVSVKTKLIVPEKIDTLEIFRKFATDFNTHLAKNINSYIDPKLGLAMYYHDGPYPILQVKNSVDQEIDWFMMDIFENVEFASFPNYLGDFKFEKTGFFIVKNEGSFSLSDFDNSYTAHPKEFFLEHQPLEKLCNFRAKAISTAGNTMYNFYFNFKNGKLTLLALEVENVSDIMFANKERPFIAFNDKNDIEKYFENQKIFRDKEQNASIDFDKREITYYDFPNDNPFIFETYKIGRITKDSDKIKSVEIIFYANKNKEEDGFMTYFSNKGTFVVGPMGVRPPYFYEPVKK